MDWFPPDSSVHGLSQARLLEWAAIFLSKGIFPAQEDLKNALLLMKRYHLSLRGVIIFCCWWWFSHSVTPQSCDPHGLQPTRLFCLWDFPGKNTYVGCQFHGSWNTARITKTWHRDMKWAKSVGKVALSDSLVEKTEYQVLHVLKTT